jgi:molybdate/tungstate transport system substrate-binding protein
VVRFLRLRTLTALLVIIIVIAGTAVAVLHSKRGPECRGTNTNVTSSEVLKICSAGSLGIPLTQLAGAFQNKYHVKVDIVTGGSVSIVRKVTELNYPCDLVFVADYRLIPKLMEPKFATWYIAFATNQLVIVFTNSSKYHVLVEKDPNMIFQILSRSDVTYGFSNPNMDPCGYRAVGAIALASLYYHNTSILKSLVLDKISGSQAIFLKNGSIEVLIPASFKVYGNLVMRDKSVDLIALVESGSLDYAFEYKSVAVQHHLNYVELPSEINLGDPSYSNYYSKVVVHILAGTKEEKALTMAPIVYGVTIPLTAKHKDLAIKFIKMLLGDLGRKIFAENGQNMLRKPLAYGNVPGELLDYVKIVKK